jgi:diguanylate cyclase (GGDEF)-like protein
VSNEHSCFYAAIGLTSQGDCHSLTQHMLELILSFTFIERAVIFEAYERGRGDDGLPQLAFRRFTDNLSDERAQDNEPGLVECVIKKLPVEVPLAGRRTRLVFPVDSDPGPFRVVAVDGEEISPQERVLLLNLVTLYRNQVSMLDGKERDALTGLLNRQTFDLRLMQLTELRRLHGGSAWLGALDIDHFKRVNDSYGHLLGDEVLLHFSQLMQRHFRYTDFLFRFGGEEFIVLLSNSDAEGAAQAFERFRKAVEEFDFPAVGRVTVSIGYTQMMVGMLPTTLVDWSDRALYEAKDGGRNRVVYYEHRDDKAAKRGDFDIELF